MAAAFPYIYYTLRRTDDVTFDEAGTGSRFFLPKSQKSHHYEKRKP